jgi:hypothetical protein
MRGSSGQYVFVRNGTITAALQQLDYLITEGGVIKQQAADVF